ncbi:type I restriction-modification enzyme S subunit [Candidatus Vecturithrix granuli]|uniref:Type I restriction-modification enzyme S subunit n=1 Tax=Vecturithrix granuli TaxID=1499967 RepID=A0A081C8M5_VECG1|nr:type I restriction-modification enzyme S subunit [Candidatus Vecturithrix granuli]
METTAIPKGYKRTEVGVIPSDWEVKPLGEIVDFLDGKRRPIKDSARAKMRGQYPYYGASGIIDFVNDYIFDDELILLGEDGENILSRNVRLAFRVSDKIWVNNHAHVLKPKEEFDVDYLAEKLESINYEQYNTGTAQPKLNQKTCWTIPVALPPTLAEQRAIAAALHDADALISSLERLIAKKRSLKHGAMQTLLQPQAGWEVKKVGEVFKFLNTANNSRADLFESGEIGYIHYGDIHTKWHCFLDCSKNELPLIHANKVKGIPFLEEGDLIIADASEDYEGLAVSVEIKNIGDQKIVSGLHTLLLRGNKELIADGFKGYFKNFYGVQNALIAMATGVSVYGISKTNLKEIELYLPPLKEQTHIARILSDMDAEIEALERQLAKYRQIKQGMMQNLLTGKIRLPH